MPGGRGLLPLALVGQGEDAQVGRLLYRLYGMYLVVLSACRGGETGRRCGLHGVWTGTGSGPGFAKGVRVGAAGRWPAAPARDPLQLPQGPLVGWPWERGFAQAPVCWASALLWTPGSGQVTDAELAKDFECHSNRARQASAIAEGAGACAAGGGRLAAAPACRQPCWRGTSAGCAPLWCPWGASAAWGAWSGRCLRAGLTCGSTCSSSSSTAWTRGAGRKDHFLAAYLPRRPGGGAPARPFEIVRAQRPRAVGVARPRRHRAA